MCIEPPLFKNEGRSLLWLYNGYLRVSAPTMWFRVTMMGEKDGMGWCRWSRALGSVRACGTEVKGTGNEQGIKGF